MRVYRNVVVEADGIIRGEYTQAPETATSSWMRFSANRELLQISEAMERHEGLYELVWLLQDGYGEPGFTPPQGWDWSGIRDSSPDAIRSMVDLVSGVFGDEELDAVLGI